MLVAGQRIRHRKQPAWGVGVVQSAARAGALVELVIEFTDTTRTLKLKPEIVETMIEVLSAADNAAIDAREAAAEKAVAAEAKARTARMKSKKLEPTTRIAVGSQSIADTGDGHVMVALDSGELRVYAPDGSVVESIELPYPGEYTTFSPGARFVPSDLYTDGQGLFVGKRTHNWGDLVFARRGNPKATMWKSPRDLGVTNVSVNPGVGAVVRDLESVLLAGADGSVHEVPLLLGGRNVGSAEAWHDGVLVGTHGKDDEHFHRYLYVGRDGTVRHEGVGGRAQPLDDELMLTFDYDGVMTRDRTGTVTGRLARSVEWGWTSNTHQPPPCLRFDDELVFALASRAGLVRWHPRVDQPRWVWEVDDRSVVAPVRVGRWLAATLSVYATHDAPKIYVVDAETGTLVHALDLKKPISHLVPIGDDALFASVFSKQPIAWRGLSRKQPERLMLVHPHECRHAVSPAPGSLVTIDHKGINFFTL